MLACPTSFMLSSKLLGLYCSGEGEQTRCLLLKREAGVIQQRFRNWLEDDPGHGLDE